MKLLCIGNSFSQNACAFMTKIAEAGNFDLTTVNLFIGGCPLERHCENIGKSDDENLYVKYVDAVRVGKISLDEALAEDKYDIVSVQQASPVSGVWETYVPYLEELVSHVRKFQPEAKIAVHQTWAYEVDSQIPRYGTRQVMHDSLTECYKRAYELINADLFIPCGNVIEALRCDAAFNPELYGTRLSSDGKHLSVCYGNYAAGLTWCAALGMKDVEENTFLPPFVDVRRDKIDIIKKTVRSIVPQEA